MFHLYVVRVAGGVPLTQGMGQYVFLSQALQKFSEGKDQTGFVLDDNKSVVATFMVTRDGVHAIYSNGVVE